MLRKIARVVIAVTGVGLGLAAGYGLRQPVQRLLGTSLGLWQTLLYFAGMGILVGLVAYVVAPAIITAVWSVTNWFEARLQRAPVQDVLAGAFGLIVGLIIASLLGSNLSRIPYVGSYLPVVTAVILGYLGLSVAVKKREELVALFAFGRSGTRDRSGAADRSGHDRAELARTEATAGRPKILDTSVIIDGRIADICETGFIEGPLVVPAFVLEELRRIADSSDTLKRNRGRRGLDVLNRIQKQLSFPVEVYERDLGAGLDVDAKLVKLAQLTGGCIVTNDYNLNKVADLQGVKVLNINELANAVKPVVLPGEEMIVHVIKDGKESGQGVAYLDDGTMIVVDGGKRHIGETIDVMVTSVLQTAAGRMIFARPKTAEAGRSFDSKGLERTSAF